LAVLEKLMDKICGLEERMHQKVDVKKLEKLESNMSKWLQQNTDLKTLDELEGRINQSIEEKLKEKVDVKEMEEMCNNRSYANSIHGDYSLKASVLRVRPATISGSLPLIPLCQFKYGFSIHTLSITAKLIAFTELPQNTAYYCLHFKCLKRRCNTSHHMLVIDKVLQL